MTGWRARLAILRGKQGTADSAESVGSPPEAPAAGPTGTNAAIGIGMDEVEVPRRAAFLARATAEAAEALAAPDQDLAYERGEVAAALAAEGRGEFGRVRPDAEHRQAVTTLLAVAAQRQPE